MAGHINVRVHNKRTLELKLEYIPSGSPDESDYDINLFMFFPENTGINHDTYEKKYFFYDLFRSIRLKSPDYMLSDYHKRLKSFSEDCSDLSEDKKCGYQFRKLITGYRTMMRNSAASLGKTSIQADIDYLLDNVRKNRNIFRRLNKDFGDSDPMFAYADEFTSIVTNVYLVRLYERLENSSHELFETVKSELKYRKKHFPESVPGDKQQNSRLISRYDYLKGYFYNVLSLRAKRKPGDKTVKNILYAAAAGISMVVATVIAFWAQKRYGNFTLPFFTALVLGYMFKDRIKDGFRSLLEKLAKPVMYDFITQIYESTGTHPMGKTWERAGFITEKQLPDYLENPNLKSSILHFNKKVHINHKKINTLLDPEIHGITDIMRLNVNRFTSGLEEPMALMYSVRNDSLEKTLAEKIYDIDLFLRVDAGGQTETLRGVLTMSARGIKNFRIL